MQAITLNQAQADLPGVVSRVIDDAEPVIICAENGQQAVCLSLDEFNSWKETLYLLSRPANAAHLRKSLAEVNAGLVHPQELVEHEPRLHSDRVERLTLVSSP